MLYDGETLVSTASLANNVMKCFLVKKEYNGQNVTNQMFSHLVSILSQKNIFHYFVYTTPNNEVVFTSLNMKRVVATMNTVLLEGGDNILNVLRNKKPISSGIYHRELLKRGRIHLCINLEQ